MEDLLPMFAVEEDQVPNDPEWDRQTQDLSYRPYSASPTPTPTADPILVSVNRALREMHINPPPPEDMIPLPIDRVRPAPTPDPTIEGIDRRMRERSQREGYPDQPEPGYEPEPPPDPKNAPPLYFRPLANYPATGGQPRPAPSPTSTPDPEDSYPQMTGNWNGDPIAGQPNRVLQPGSFDQKPIIQMIKENAGSDPLFKDLEDKTRRPDSDYVAQWIQHPAAATINLASKGAGMVREAFNPSTAGTDPMSFQPQELMRQLRQGILSDEDLAEIKRDPTSLQSLQAIAQGAIMLSGGEGRGNLPRGAVPRDMWMSWKISKQGKFKVNPTTGDHQIINNQVRVDNAGNHYEEVGRHKTADAEHVIVQPVEPPAFGTDWDKTVGDFHDKWKKVGDLAQQLRDLAQMSPEDYKAKYPPEQPSEKPPSDITTPEQKPVSHLSAAEMDQFMKWTRGDESAYPGDELINKLKKTNGPSLWDHYQYQKRHPDYKPPKPAGVEGPGDVGEGEEWKQGITDQFKGFLDKMPFKEHDLEAEDLADRRVLS